MTDKNQDFYDELFGGLKELAESSFPKKCANCGREYQNAEQFLRETESINNKITGLKASVDDDGIAIVEAFRNCPCGSTLMDFFSDRRDLSVAGLGRRKKFEEMMVFLTKNGLDKIVARNELLKVLRGERSEILANIQPPGDIAK